MQFPEIGSHRLISQQIAQPALHAPGAVVRWMGAMQAQDYAAALWAVGVRTVDATEATVTQALAERRIVRTWLMRGTIHLAAPDDIRWMLDLLAPRVIQQSQGRLRELGLDAATLSASATVIANALSGGRQLTRPALMSLLEEAGIATGNQRGYTILAQLAYAQLICFGAHEGKQATFALLDERLHAGPRLPRDEALATLALRYFTSHGPATLPDFIWWSGVSSTDAKAGLGAVADQLTAATVNGTTFYYAAPLAVSDAHAAEALLLPGFDEYLIAYRDRSAILDPAYNRRIVPGGNGIFKPMLVSAGQIVGTWQRTVKRNAVTLAVHPFAPDDPLPTLNTAIARYAHFLDLPITYDNNDAAGGDRD